MTREFDVRNFISADAFRRAFSRICDLFVSKKEGYDLSKNDFSDKYRTKLDELENYNLPPATKKNLGGITIGDGLDVDSNGRTSVIFPDLSQYVTFRDMKNDNNEIELRFTKIENAAKQKQSNDDAIDTALMRRLVQCESKATDAKKEADENLKRFENYITLSEHDTAIAEISSRLEDKADLGTLSEALSRKITRSDLDGSIINLLDTIRSEQDMTAEDRENLRSVKTDIASLNNLRQLVSRNSEDINYITQEMGNYLTKDVLDGYVKAEPGKMLSDRNFTSSDWDKLRGLHNYTLPVANRMTLGGIKAGKNVEVEEDGTLNIEIPGVEHFAVKEDSDKMIGELSDRVSSCENSTAKHSETITTLSSSLESEKKKVASLEATTREHTSSLSSLSSYATKEELTSFLSTISKTKLNIDEFERHLATKLGPNDFNDYVKDKFEKIVSMTVEMNNLQRVIRNVESGINRCIGRIRNLNNAMLSIRNDIPDSHTYVRTQPGKGLSSNDYTSEEKSRLASAVVESDIGSKVVGLGENNKIDPKYLPEENFDIKFVNDINDAAIGSEDTLYFNKTDKKLYYYDGMNFRPIHDNFYNDNGVDMRTEMADTYVRKEDVRQDNAVIESLQKYCLTADEKIGNKADQDVDQEVDEILSQELETE